LRPVQRQRPGQRVRAVCGGDWRRLAAEGLLDADQSDRVAQRAAQRRKPPRPELGIAGLPGQNAGGHGQDRVVRRPSRGDALLDLVFLDHGQGPACGHVVREHPGDVVDRRRRTLAQSGRAGGERSIRVP
jgi:hypothetical protein